MIIVQGRIIFNIHNNLQGLIEKGVIFVSEGSHLLIRLAPLWWLYFPWRKYLHLSKYQQTGNLFHKIPKHNYLSPIS